MTRGEEPGVQCGQGSEATCAHTVHRTVEPAHALLAKVCVTQSCRTHPQVSRVLALHAAAPACRAYACVERLEMQRVRSADVLEPQTQPHLGRHHG